MVKPFIRHSSTIVLTTPIFRVRQDNSTNPHTGHNADYYVLENPNWVNVIALDEARNLIMVRQWRHGTREIEVEFPAGLVDPGEEPQRAASRELKEETGFEVGTIRRIGVTHPNLAYQSNTCFTFLAEGCRKVAEPEFDRGEHVETFLVAPGELSTLIRDGRIRSAVSLSAVLWWMEHRGGVNWS